MTQDNGSTELIRALKGEVQLAIRDPEEASAAIVERVLSAPTIEDVFNVAGTLGADDMLKVPFMFEAAEFAQSDFAEGSPIYAIMKGTRVDDGSEFVLSCGGRNVVAQLIATVKFGGCPFPLQLERNEKATAAGFYPLWLHRVA